jgi:hypothetical protein
VVENIVDVCAEFPAVSPVEVWRLRYDVWMGFLATTGAIARERERRAREAS